VTGCFDSDVLIDYFDGIATAAEELSHYERVLISRITWMEVLGALLVTRNTRDFDPTEPGVRIPDRLS
jgi:predicted nucleic acid-binding protein